MAPFNALLDSFNLDKKILSVKQTILIALVAWYGFVEYDSIQDTKAAVEYQHEIHERDKELEDAKLEYNRERASRVAKREATEAKKDMYIKYLEDQLKQCRNEH